MTPKVNKTDNTRNQRQARRREREKQWLEENSWQSWEALHTALIKDTVRLLPRKVVASQTSDDQQVSDVNMGKH